MNEDFELVTKSDFAKAKRNDDANIDHLIEKIELLQEMQGKLNANVGEVYRLVRRGVWTVIILQVVLYVLK